MKEFFNDFDPLRIDPSSRNWLIHGVHDNQPIGPVHPFHKLSLLGGANAGPWPDPILSGFGVVRMRVVKFTFLDMSSL